MAGLVQQYSEAKVLTPVLHLLGGEPSQENFAREAKSFYIIEKSCLVFFFSMIIAIRHKVTACCGHAIRKVINIITTSIN